MIRSVKDNPTLHRFELDMHGQTVFATYRRHGDVVHIAHVEAPPSLRGTGAAGRLMEGIMEIARAQSVKIVPHCSYAALWMRRHPETHDLMG